MSGTWTARDATRFLRAPTDRDDKYSRGVVGLRTGSGEYPGAAVLGAEAAWRTGAGMVRYLGPDLVRTLVLQRRPETVTVDGRVQAWVIGSGTAAPEEDRADAPAALRSILAGPAPVVVDAGALAFAVGAAAARIVTPHDREHERLRTLLGLAAARVPREESARETAAALGGVVVLKGPRTVVASPTGWTTAVDAGTPWLATAGTGDVLAGAIGAVVAGALAGGAGEPDRTAEPDELAQLAATGVWLHGRAGTLAARDRGSAGGPISALDVAEALPRAVAEVLAGRAG